MLTHEVTFTFTKRIKVERPTPVLLANGLVTMGHGITFLFTVTVDPLSSAYEIMKAWHTHGLSFLRLFRSKMVKSIGSLQLEVPITLLWYVGVQQMSTPLTSPGLLKSRT
jgi:hypothetical protein